MEEIKKPEKVDWIVHESIVASMERHIKRLWILCIIIFAALIGTNAGWIWYESQFEDQVITQEIAQDSGLFGNNAYTGRIIGGDYNGEAENQDADQAPGA